MRLILLIALTCLCGCTSGSNSPGTTIFPKIEIYGRFCGPDHPRVEGASSADRIDKLSAIEPVDDLDQLCKTHDICYERAGAGRLDCEVQFAREMRAMNLTQRCHTAASLMLATVATFSTQRQSDGIDPAETTAQILALPLRGMMFMRALEQGVMNVNGMPPEGSCRRHSTNIN